MVKEQSWSLCKVLYVSFNDVNDNY